VLMGARGQQIGERDPAGLRSEMYYTVLGLIIGEPSHGYKLQQRYERMCGELRPLSSKGQIYKSLESLEEKGMIEKVPSPPSSAHNKTHFRHTALGMELYERRFVARAAEDVRQARVEGFELATLPPRVALIALHAYEKACFAAAREMSGADVDAEADEVTRLAQRLAIEAMRTAHEGRIAWIEYARRELQALCDQEHGGEHSAEEESPGDGAARA
jgi:DNA-binding PadR family transcriptional regulator